MLRSFGGESVESVRKKIRSSAIAVSVEILPVATQQCRNYLYDKIVL